MNEKKLLSYYKGYRCLNYKDDGKLVKAEIELIKRLILCRHCHSNSATAKREYTRVFYTFIDGRVAEITVVATVYYCNNCKERFSDFYDDFMRNGAFDYRFYQMVTEKYTSSSVRAISKMLLDNYSVDVNYSTLSLLLKKNPPSKEKKETILPKIEEDLDENVLVLNNKKVIKHIIENDVDVFASMIVNYSDRIINQVDEAFSLIDIINDSFGTIGKHKDCIQAALYIISTIAARMREITATYQSNVMISDPALVNKLMSMILIPKDDGTYFSSSAIKEFINRNYRDEKKRYISHKKVKELFASFNKCYKNLAKACKKLYLTYKGHGLLAIDGTLLPIPNIEKCDLAGTLKKNNEIIQGYKALNISRLLQNCSIFVQADIKSIETHDSKMALGILSKNRVLMKGDILISDRGFIGEKMIKAVKAQKADVIFPLKNNMHITKDAVGMASNIDSKKSDGPQWEKYGDKFEIVLIEDVSFYRGSSKKTVDEGYNVAVLRRKKSVKFFTSRENEENEQDCSIMDGEYKYNVFFYSGYDLSAKDILEIYKMRWEIETAFKESKSYYQICNITSRIYEHIVYHVLSTFLAFNVGKLYSNIPEGESVGTSALPLYVKKKNERIRDPKDSIFFAKKDRDFAMLNLPEFMRINRQMSQENSEGLMDKMQNWNYEDRN